MKKGKKIPAYTDGRPTFKNRTATGVYFIYEGNNEKPSYIGYSASSLYSALYRHFQSWNDKTQQRFTYSRNSKIRVILTTPKRAALLEKYLIIKMKPKDNVIKYENYLSDSEIKQVEELSKKTVPATNDDLVPF